MARAFAARVGDRIAYLTPDELLSKQAYDKDINFGSIGLGVGVDMPLALALLSERLGMTATKLRDGVLLFIASEEQRFVILGDRGIDDKVPSGFWDDIAARLTSRFKKGEFTDGIVEAIESAGEHLKTYFPHSADDTDELSDDLDITEH